MSNERPNRPFASPKAGTVSVPIWSRTVEKNGRTFEVYSAQIQNQYYDEETKQWRDSTSFSAHDLADLEICLLEARKIMRLRTDTDSSTSDKRAE